MQIFAVLTKAHCIHSFYSRFISNPNQNSRCTLQKINERKEKKKKRIVWSTFPSSQVHIDVNTFVNVEWNNRKKEKKQPNSIKIEKREANVTGRAKTNTQKTNREIYIYKRETLRSKEKTHDEIAKIRINMDFDSQPCTEFLYCLLTAKQVSFCSEKRDSEKVVFFLFLMKMEAKKKKIKRQIGEREWGRDRERVK